MVKLNIFPNLVFHKFIIKHLQEDKGAALRVVIADALSVVGNRQLYQKVREKSRVSA